MRVSTTPKFLLMHRVGLKSKQVLKNMIIQRETKKKKKSFISFLFKSSGLYLPGGLVADARRQCFRESLTFIYDKSQTAKFLFHEMEKFPPFHDSWTQRSFSVVQPLKVVTTKSRIYFRDERALFILQQHIEAVIFPGVYITQTMYLRTSCDHWLPQKLPALKKLEPNIPASSILITEKLVGKCCFNNTNWIKQVQG